MKTNSRNFVAAGDRKTELSYTRKNPVYTGGELICKIERFSF